MSEMVRSPLIINQVQKLRRLVQVCDEPAVLHDRTLLTTTWGRSHARSGLCEGCSMPPIAHNTTGLPTVAPALSATLATDLYKWRHPRTPQRYYHLLHTPDRVDHPILH